MLADTYYRDSFPLFTQKVDSSSANKIATFLESDGCDYKHSEERIIHLLTRLSESRDVTNILNSACKAGHQSAIKLILQIPLSYKPSLSIYFPTCHPQILPLLFQHLTIDDSLLEVALLCSQPDNLRLLFQHHRDDFLPSRIKEIISYNPRLLDSLSTVEVCLDFYNLDWLTSKSIQSILEKHPSLREKIVSIEPEAQDIIEKRNTMAQQHNAINHLFG